MASVLAHKIISSYPEKISFGEINFASITEKANNLCEILLKGQANERVAFELAILGLTVPRPPARTNIEEVSLTFDFLVIDFIKVSAVVTFDSHKNFILQPGMLEPYVVIDNFCCHQMYNKQPMQKVHSKS